MLSRFCTALDFATCVLCILVRWTPSELRLSLQLGLLFCFSCSWDALSFLIDFLVYLEVLGVDDQPHGQLSVCIECDTSLIGTVVEAPLRASKAPAPRLRVPLTACVLSCVMVQVYILSHRCM